MSYSFFSDFFHNTVNISCRLFTDGSCGRMFRIPIKQGVLLDYRYQCKMKFSRCPIPVLDNKGQLYSPTVPEVPAAVILMV